MNTLTVCCDARAADCRCILEPHHPGPHTCHFGCRGQWTGTHGQADFRVVTWPLGWNLSTHGR